MHVRSLARNGSDAAKADHELLQAFITSGDADSFQELLARHGPMVWRLCWRLLRQTQDVEDAFQATFVLLARRAASIRNCASLGGWLHGVAYRLALQVRRARKNMSSDSEATSRVNVLDELTVREAQALLHEELDRLSDRLRAPLLLCYLEGLTQDAAARRLGWSLNTLKRRLNRGRDLLRRRLARRGLSWAGALAIPALLTGEASARVPAAVFATTMRLVQDVAGASAQGSIPVGVSALLKTTGRATLSLSQRAVRCLFSCVIVLALGLGLYQAFLAAQPTDPPAEPPLQVPTPAQAPADPPPAGPKPPAVLKAPEGLIHQMALSPDGDRVGALAPITTQKTLILVWNAGTGKSLAELFSLDRPVQALAFHPDGKSIVYGDAGGKLITWDVNASKQKSVHMLPGDKGFHAIVFSPDGTRMAAVDSRDDLTVWDPATGKILKTAKAHTERTWSVAFHPKVNLVATAGWDSCVKIWDVATLDCRATLTSPLKEMASNSAGQNTVAFNPDGTWLATGGYRGVVELWSIKAKMDGETAFAAATFKHKIEVSKEVIAAVAFSPDGRLLAVGSWDKKVYLYDTESRKLLKEFTDHKNRVLSVAFHPKGHLLVSGSLDGTVRLWDISAWQKAAK